MEVMPAMLHLPPWVKALQVVGGMKGGEMQTTEKSCRVFFTDSCSIFLAVSPGRIAVGRGMHKTTSLIHEGMKLSNFFNMIEVTPLPYNQVSRNGV